MAADLVAAIASAALVRFAGAGLDHYGKVALERAQQVGNKALSMLTAVGREPQPVEPKLLVPLVQAASLETDEALCDRWAALLANAADSAQQVTMLPGFTEILRQITPLDASILQAVADGSQGQENELRTYLYYPSTRIQGVVGGGDGAPTTTYQIAVDNLLRLRLCDGRGVTRPPVGPSNTLSDLIGGHAAMLAEGPGKDRLAVTDLGLVFLAAVTPPII